MKSKTLKKKSTNRICEYLVKLRIDIRTVIFVKDKESLKRWKTQYPDAIELL